MSQMRELSSGAIAGTNLVLIGGAVCCPKCGSEEIIHAYDTSYRTTLFEVDHDKIVAVGHKGEECHTYRVWCLSCGWHETDCGIDVA